MLTIPAKTIVSGWSDCGWFGSNYNMNIYKGCCHGCIYCDSRSDCYRIDHFDEVRAKENALEVIERDLRSKRKTGVVISGSMSDAYNPHEKGLELTRGALKLLERYGFGIVIDTKSTLVVRDIDLLLKIKEYSPAVVNFTVTTFDDGLCRKIEQHVAVTSERFSAMKTLSNAGLMTGVLLMPILPFINDTPANIAGIVRKAFQSGASYIYPGFCVTLRQNQREYFYERLDEQFPGVKEKYQKAYGSRYECVPSNHDILWSTFTAQCEKYGLPYKMNEIVEKIRSGYTSGQMTLFPGMDCLNGMT